MQFFFPDRDMKIEEFMYDKNEFSDKAINLYGEYKEWLYLAEQHGIPATTLDAFAEM